MIIHVIVVIVSVLFIRKHIKTKEVLPYWDSVLAKLPYFAPIIYLGSEIVGGFAPLFDLLWFIVYATIVFVLWLLEDNRISKALLYAAFPFFIINSTKDLAEFIIPGFVNNYNSYLDLAWTGGFLWMIAFGISAHRQQKALLKEVAKNEIILTQNEKLEVLVSERTSKISQQKEALENSLSNLKAAQNQLILSEKMASLGELTAGIAHEIQNPLNFVNNFSEVNSELIQELLEEIENENFEDVKLIAKDINQNEKKIIEHGKRADGIVKGMLQHSRTSTGEKELTDINDLADEFLRLAFHGLRAKDKSFNVKMETNFDENLKPINAVAQDIGRVFLNLITNAFHAVAEKKQSGKDENYAPLVIVETKKLPDFVLISVEDNGNGMPKKILDKIFQPFFTTKVTGKGTGLGLSLSYDIVNSHGGELTVKSKSGKGSKFFVHLPIT